MIDLLNTLPCDNLSTKMRDGFRVFTYCQFTCEIKRTRKKVFKVTFFFCWTRDLKFGYRSFEYKSNRYQGIIILGEAGYKTVCQ